jgi:hypothetical protein
MLLLLSFCKASDDSWFFRNVFYSFICKIIGGDTLDISYQDSLLIHASGECIIDASNICIVPEIGYLSSSGA